MQGVHTTVTVTAGLEQQCVTVLIACRVAGGKFRPTYLPEAADRIDAQGIDKFEVAGPEVAQEKVTYGLQQRSRPQVRPVWFGAWLGGAYGEKHCILA